MGTRRGEAAIHEALTFAKRRAMSMEGVHGVDYGFAYVDGERTNQRRIRFHVRRKLPSAELPASRLLPGDIRGIPVDVMETGYRPHAGDPSAQQAALSRGISVGNLATGETGTLGALVRGAQGETYILSNWHVLSGAPEAQPGDQIVQPGRCTCPAPPTRWPR
jgi:hypothetical protein